MQVPAPWHGQRITLSDCTSLIRHCHKQHCMCFPCNAACICCEIKAKGRAVSLLSVFGVVTSAHGTTSWHVTLLLLQSHSAANMQLHRFL